MTNGQPELWSEEEYLAEWIKSTREIPPGVRGQMTGAVALTSDQIAARNAEILRKFEVMPGTVGARARELAREYHLSLATVENAIYQRTYKSASRRPRARR